MTNDNTTRKKANAVFFSVIMVISMAAVGFAAAPAAAVTNSGENVEITYTEITDGDTVLEGTEVTPEVDVNVTDGDGNISDIDGVENIAFGTVEDDGSFNVIEEDSIGDAGIDDLGPNDDSVTVAFEDNAPGTIGDLAPGEYDHQVALVDDGGEIVEAGGVDYASDELTLTINEDLGERDADVEVDDVDLADELVFSGQSVAVELTQDGVEEGDTVTLRRTTGDTSSTPVSQLTVQQDNDGLYVQFNTADRQTDDYFLRGAGLDRDDNDAVGTTFEIVEQDLEADFDPDEVDNDGDNTVSELDIGSELRNTYDVFLSIDGLDEEDDYEFILENSDLADSVDDAFFDADEEAVRVNDAEGVHDIDFTDVEADDYDLEVDVVDTTGFDTAEITVADVGDGEVIFVEDDYEVPQGDIVDIDLEFDDAAEVAELRIGELEEVNYQLDLEVDSDGAEEVSVEFNTFTAGFGSDVVDLNDPDDLERVVTVTTDDDDADPSVEFIGDQADATTGGSILGIGSYSLDLVQVGGDLDDTDELSELFIEDRAINENVNIWTASSGNFDDIEEFDDVSAAVDDGLLTETDEIAEEDVVVHEINADGLEGLINEAGSLTEALTPRSEATDGFDLRLRQTAATTGANQPRKVIDVAAMDAADDVTILSEDGTYYLAFDSDDIQFMNVDDDADIDGDAYDVDFRVKDDRLLDYDDEDTPSDFYATASGSYEFVERMAEWDIGDDDLIQVEAADGQELTGETSIAPGSEFSPRVRSDADVSPRFRLSPQDDVVVQPDGTFSGEFDFTEASADDTFEADLRALDTVADGIVVDADEPEPAFYEVSDLEPADAEVDQGDVIDEISATITNTGDEDGDQTVELRIDQDGENVYTEDRDIGLDAGDETTVVFDDVGTDGLEGDYEHGIYTDDDEAVGTLTVNVDDDAPDEDDDDTDADDDDDTDADDDDTDADDDDADDTDDVDDAEDDTPGFGAIVALVALIAAALLATRRRN